MYEDSLNRANQKISSEDTHSEDMSSIDHKVSFMAIIVPILSNSQPSAAAKIAWLRRQPPLETITSIK